MNTHLFSIHNVVLSTRLGNKDIPDCEYSVMWHEVIQRGKREARVDSNSVKRQEWNKGVAQWVPARIDAPILDEIERQLQDELERQEIEDEQNVADVAAGWE